MNEFTDPERKILLDLARQAITFGVEKHLELKVDLVNYPEKLRAERACFVTLKIAKALRGCIGSLQAYEPLVANIAHNAFLAAFSDPRFAPVEASELKLLSIHISILTVPKPIACTSEADLICKIKPNIDGLILSEKGLCGTFLPSVWEEIKEPRLFLQHLKMKAGLPPNYWSDTVKVECYTTESFGDQV
jgi:uncharacterized protein